MKNKIVIVGAGLSGLSCVYHLTKPYQLFEKESEAGGLCRSVQMKGFTFDYTGHLLHFKTRSCRQLVQKLLQGNLARHFRRASVFMRNKLIPYPLQAHINDLPAAIRRECYQGYRLRNCKRASVSFYDWMESNFGKGIVRHFLYPFNRKFWRMDSRRLTCDWHHGNIPTISRKILESSPGIKNRIGYNWEFWYPKNGGIGVLARSFTRNLQPVHYRRNLTCINLRHRIATFNKKEDVSFNSLVLSLPLPEIIQKSFPVSDEVSKAAKQLKHLSVFNLNLGVKGSTGLDAHWIYFPESEISFYRMGFYSAFSQTMAPEGHVSLYIEVSYRNKSFSFVEDYGAKTAFADLQKTCFFSHGTKIVAQQRNTIRYAYIIYDRAYQEARRTVLNFLHSQKIFPIGRFGSWRYMSMEDCIIQGRETAEALNNLS